MRKVMLAIAGIALATGFAGAQDLGGTSDTVTIQLEGELEKRCTIGAFVNGPFNAIDMESTAQQGAESLTVNCNYGGSADIEFSSASGGNLVSGTNSVGYQLAVSGGVLAPTQLTSAATGTFSGFSANANASRSMSVTLLAPATVAGVYTDTLTAVVTPN